MSKERSGEVGQYHKTKTDSSQIKICNLSGAVDTKARASQTLRYSQITQGSGYTADSRSVGLAQGWDSAFLLSSQVTLKLLVLGLHFD